MTMIAGSTSQRPGFSTSSSTAYRLAIVGGGPRALSVIDLIRQKWTELGTCRAIDITIFDPSPYPGAGAVYDPRQPKWLRMNYPSCRVSAWSDCPDGTSFRPSFVEWAKLTDQDPTVALGYAPRAMVGEYLSVCFQALKETLPAEIVCTIQPEAVARVRLREGRVDIGTWDGLQSFDEAVITTGHGTAMPARIDPDKFTGKSVALRGFALTAIDAILTLSEGVGGRFEERDRDWTYLPSGREPSSIVPFSRTGKALHAKPSPQLAEAWQAYDGWQRHAATLAKLQARHGDLDFASEIRPVLTHAADDFLAWTSNVAAGSYEGWCRDWLELMQQTEEDESPFMTWQKSYSMAVGGHPPDPSIAFAECWRQLYPQLVRLISHGGLRTDSFDDWSQTAIAMERIAFGPPAESIGRMIALVESGLLDVRFVVAPSIRKSDKRCYLELGSDQVEVDEILHAVIASPSDNANSEVIGNLLKEGYFKQSSVAGGVMVDRRGRPIGTSGQARRRLSLFGRATEGWIVGNDTLNRDLHPEAAAWAIDLAQKLSHKRKTP